MKLMTRESTRAVPLAYDVVGFAAIDGNGTFDDNTRLLV